MQKAYHLSIQASSFPLFCAIQENLIDITYRLRESYGVELAEALVHYGFHELKLPEITATITPDNLASQKIAKKLGFIFDQKIILLGVPTELYRLRK